MTITGKGAMKKLTKIFREAARLIAEDENEGQRACAALWRAQGGPETEFARDYGTAAHLFLKELFLPHNGSFSADGDDDLEYSPWDMDNTHGSAANERRILALLLLAAMSEAGDL